MRKQFLAFTLVNTMMITGSLFYAQNTLPTTGNVGIGTATPSAALEVNGETKLGAVTVRDTAKFELPVIIKDSVTIEKKLRVDQDVRIIGNTVMVDNARAKSNFTVEGTTKVQGNLRLFNLADSTQTDDKILIVRPNGLVKDYSFGELKALVIAEAYGKDCKLDDNGVSLTHPIWKSTPGILYTGETCPAKVGIGIAAPVEQLHVLGSGRFTGNLGVGVASTTSTRLIIEQKQTNSNGLVVNYTATNANGTGVGVQVNMTNVTRKAIVVNDGAYDVFRVYGNGVVYAQEYNARLKEEFPDYVFKPNYELMPLDSLRTYIIENGKLPHMPSAQEVAENGVNLAELNRILVEKIEELTLYLLQQQAEIEALKNSLK